MALVALPSSSGAPIIGTPIDGTPIGGTLIKWNPHQWNPHQVEPPSVEPQSEEPPLVGGWVQSYSGSTHFTSSWAATQPYFS